MCVLFSLSHEFLPQSMVDMRFSQRIPQQNAHFCFYFPVNMIRLHSPTGARNFVVKRLVVVCTPLSDDLPGTYFHAW